MAQSLQTPSERPVVTQAVELVTLFYHHSSIINTEVVYPFPNLFFKRASESPISFGWAVFFGRLVGLGFFSAKGSVFIEQGNALAGQVYLHHRYLHGLLYLYHGGGVFHVLVR